MNRTPRILPRRLPAVPPPAHAPGATAPGGPGDALAAVLAGLAVSVGLLLPACSARAGDEVLERGLVVLDARGQVPVGAHPEAADDPDAGHDDHDHDNPDRPYFHDFGLIQDGDSATHLFRLRNTDSLPVTVERVKPSCGCTVPTLALVNADGSRTEGDVRDEPEILVVPPGGEVELEIQIETSTIAEKNSRKLVQVRITTDSRNDPFVTLEASLLVEQAFRLETSPIRLPDMPASIGGRASARVIQASSTRNVLTGVGPLPDGVLVELVEEPVAGVKVWTMEIEVLPPLSLGPWTMDIELLAETVDGEPAPSFFPRVIGRVVPDVALVPSRLVLQGWKGEHGATAEAELTCNVPGQRIAITDTHVRGEFADHVEVDVRPVGDADGRGRSARWVVELSVRDAPDVDTFAGRVVLVLDDPQTPEIELGFVAL